MADPTIFLGQYILKQARKKCLKKLYGASFNKYLIVLKLFPNCEAFYSEFIECFCCWIDILHHSGRKKKIKDAFTKAKTICSFSEILMCAFVRQAIRIELFSTGIQLVEEMKESFGENPCVRETLECVSYAAVERWHFKMLNDISRNKAYYTAIQQAMQDLDVSSVLDIGCGTESSGAKSITMCDASLVMTGICSSVMQDHLQHHLSDKVPDIHILHALSTSLSVPVTIGKRVDLVVTEIFDAAVFGEHCLSTLSHAWSHLIDTSEDKSGLVIPASARLFVCAIECAEVRKENFLHPGNVPLLDMGGITIISKTSFTNDEPYTTEALYYIRDGYRNLSSIKPFLDVDFNDPKGIENLAKYTSEFSIDIVASGVVDALAVWFDLDLFKGIGLSSSPSARCCWEQAVFPILSISEGSVALPAVNPGDQMTLTCCLIDGCLQLKLKHILSSLDSALACVHISQLSATRPEADTDREQIGCEALLSLQPLVHSASVSRLVENPDTSLSVVDTVTAGVENGCCHKGSGGMAVLSGNRSGEGCVQLSLTDTFTADGSIVHDLGCSPRVADAGCLLNDDAAVRSESHELMVGGVDDCGVVTRKCLQLDDLPEPPYFCLDRGDIRHLNDTTYHSCYASALRIIIQERSCRLLAISSIFPLSSLFALRLGADCCHVCHVGLKGIEDLQLLTTRLAELNSIDSRCERWRWLGTSVPDTLIVNYENGNALWNVLAIDVLDSMGLLRSELSQELQLLRPVLTKSATIIPQMVDIYAVLIESQHLLRRSRVLGKENTLGVNIGEYINQYQTGTFMDLDGQSLHYNVLTDVVHVFRLDLQHHLSCTEQENNPSDDTQTDSSTEHFYPNCELFNQSKQLHMTTTSAGNAGAILYWLDLTLCTGINASTIDPSMNWHQAAYILSPPLAVGDQESIVLDVFLRNSFLHFSLASQSDTLNT